MEQFIRTKMLLGEQAILRLNASHVAVFGLGGVGGSCAEALVRAGIGRITLVDNDRICLSNLNRQIFATQSTVGQLKTEVAERRLQDINPNLVSFKHSVLFCEQTLMQFGFDYDYIVDAIDSVDNKLLLIETAKKRGVPIISAMGAGNKLDPSALMVADIGQTGICPLAKVIRKQLRARGITDLKVVYSREQVRVPQQLEQSPARRAVIGSTACVPPAMGLILASEVINDLCDIT